MITKTINYTDYDGTQVTDTLHFNLTEFECNELALLLPEKMMNAMLNIGDSPSQTELIAAVQQMGTKEVMEFIKQLVIKSYGVRKGKALVKNKEVVEEFEYSAAFSAIMMEFMQDNNMAAEFISKVFPASLAAKLPAEAKAALPGV